MSNRVFEGEGAECSIACSDVPSAANEDTCFDCEGLARELEQIKHICQQAPSHLFEGPPPQLISFLQIFLDVKASPKTNHCLLVVCHIWKFKQTIWDVSVLHTL